MLTFSDIAAANLTAVSEENIEPKQSFQESETLIARPKQSTSRKRRQITDPTDKLFEKAVNASQEALKSLKQQRRSDNASRFGEIIAEKLRLLGDTLDVEVKILAMINTALKKVNSRYTTSNVGVGQTTLPYVCLFNETFLSKRAVFTCSSFLLFMWFIVVMQKIG